jgi:hypothetical protein
VILAISRRDIILLDYSESAVASNMKEYQTGWWLESSKHLRFDAYNNGATATQYALLLFILSTLRAAR